LSSYSKSKVIGKPSKIIPIILARELKGKRKRSTIYNIQRIPREILAARGTREEKGLKQE